MKKRTNSDAFNSLYTQHIDAGNAEFQESQPGDKLNMLFESIDQPNQPMNMLPSPAPEKHEDPVDEESKKWLVGDAKTDAEIEDIEDEENLKKIKDLEKAKNAKDEAEDGEDVSKDDIDALKQDVLNVFDKLYAKATNTKVLDRKSDKSDDVNDKVEDMENEELLKNLSDEDEEVKEEGIWSALDSQDQQDTTGKITPKDKKEDEENDSMIGDVKGPTTTSQVTAAVEAALDVMKSKDLDTEVVANVAEYAQQVNDVRSLERFISELGEMEGYDEAADIMKAALTNLTVTEKVYTNWDEHTAFLEELNELKESDAQPVFTTATYMDYKEHRKGRQLIEPVVEAAEVAPIKRERMVDDFKNIFNGMYNGEERSSYHQKGSASTNDRIQLFEAYKSVKE